MTAVSIDQQFIEYIVKSLVGNPDAVKIERRIDEKGVLLELIVDPEDLGRVIGKRGATAQSLRTLLRALGTKNDARYNLKIVDTGGPGSRSSDDSSFSRDEPASQTPADEPASDQPSEDTSSTDTTPTDDLALDDEEEIFPEDKEKKEEDRSDVISRTRKELEELDDLDV